MLLNRDRAEQVMDRHGLDGIVAAFPENIYYLSDYWGPMFLMSRNYTLYAFLPRDRAKPAALIIPATGVYHLEHIPTWMPNVATYATWLKPDDLPARDYEFSTEMLVEPGVDPERPPAHLAPRLMPYPLREGVPMEGRDAQLLERYAMHARGVQQTATKALAGAIAAAGLSAGRLGFDDPRLLGWLGELGMEELSGVDALNVFKEIRMVKSPAEIELLREAAQRGEKALDATIAQMHVGMPLDEIATIHAVECAKLGCRSEWIIANIRGLATGVIEPNELIKLDAVASWKQYRGDVGRSVYFGEPDEEIMRRTRAVTAALGVSYSEIRPGRSFDEITRLTLKAVEEGGFPGFVIAAPHSVGLEHTDHPVSVGAQEPGAYPPVFEENMVFTLDMPYHEFGWGTIHVEDMMRVTATGCEPLSSTDTALRVRPV
ncbi:MAG TPA: M24 family metallopeptidase [Novosphingobium sp.]|nr:M24 family metallopeptidase [Novosphingobium sp.]